MPFEFPDDDGPLAPDWFAPLQLVVEAQAGERLVHFLDLDDIMIMARVVRPPRPSIVLYKHAYTRSYLNLDADGQAYRYVPARNSSHGRYLRQPLDEGLRALGLDQLPWMKPGLEREQRGWSWDERVLLRITLDREYEARGRPPPPWRHRRRRGPVGDAPAAVARERRDEAAGGRRRGHLHLV
jgi:hypothetical protein